MHLLKILRIFLSALFVLGVCKTSSAQPINPNLNWNAIGTGAAGPITRGATLSAVNASGTICVAGEVDQNGSRIIRVATLRYRSQQQAIGFGLQDPVFTSVGAVAWANNGDIYVGGSFRDAINSDGSVVAVNNIARWNAANGRWQSLGQGIGGHVAAIAVDASQNVYVSGNLFQGNNPDGTPVLFNYIGKWNNTQGTWEPLGDGADNQATALAIAPGGGVIAAGDFTNVFDAANTPVAANGIAAWNGNSWETFGQGLRQLPNAGFLFPKMVLDTSGNPIVAGHIDAAINSNGVSVAGPIVRWDGNGWISLTNSLTVIYPISGLALDALGTIYMLHYANEQGVLVISALTGTTWTRLAELRGINSFYTIASNPSYARAFLYAGGRFSEFEDRANMATMAIANNTWWDGNIWRQFSQPGATGEVFVIEVDNTQLPQKLYAGGSFTSVNEIPANNIAVFDGQNWQAVSGGVNGPVHAIKPISFPWDGVFVGGSFSEAGNPDGSVVSVSNLAFWEESTQQWHNIGGFDGPVYALENFGGVILYAGGDFTSSTNGNIMHAISRFNIASQTWSALAGGVIGGGESGVVRALRLNAPNYGRGSVFIHLYVGGKFGYGASSTNLNEAYYQPSSNVILWDEGADRWRRLGSGTDDEVLALAIPRYSLGDLWVGGRFLTAVNRDLTVTADVPYAAIWNGYQWSKLAQGVNGPVHSIGLLNGGNSGRAFLGGAFTEATNSDGSLATVNHIAVFERTSFAGVAVGSWETLGSGTDSTVNSIASVWPCPEANYDVFYAGGHFLKAGTKIVRGLAKWKAPLPSSRRGTSSAVINSPSRRQNGQPRRNRVVVRSEPFACGLGLGKATQDEIVLFEDLGFRETAVIPDLPYLQPFSIILYDADNPGQPIAVYDSLVIASDKPKLLVLFGVDDTTAYAPNPDGISTAESVLLQDLIIASEVNETPVVFVHGITDAPMLDLVTQTGDTLIADLKYGAVSSQLGLAPGSYAVELLRSSDKQKLGEHSFILPAQSETYSVVTLSGFLDPAANQNGPALAIDNHEVPLDMETSVETGETDINAPDDFTLHPNYPNPFNPSTNIAFSLPRAQHITLIIYDVLGRKIVTLVDKRLTSGEHTISFDAQGSASGVYFASIKVGRKQFIQKMLLIR